jgi:hypothetical protein
MKLNQFDKVGKGQRTRYTTNVPDITGAEDYQLVVAGSDVLIKKILKDTDFSITIDPKATEDDWNQSQQPLWEEQKATLSSIASLENVKDFLKRQPSIQSIENSIFISLHRIRGEGTFYVFNIPYFSLLRGQSIFFALFGTANFCSGYVQPLSGDADLFLSSNSPSGTPLTSSTLGGTATDRVFYGPAWFFVPWFRIFGFTNTTGAAGFASWTALPF